MQYFGRLASDVGAHEMASTGPDETGLAENLEPGTGSGLTPRDRIVILREIADKYAAVRPLVKSST